MLGPARLLESKADVEDFIRFLYAPSVLVSATQSASDSLQQATGMSPADLFRPFGLSSRIVNGDDEEEGYTLPIQLRMRHTFDPSLEKAARCYKALYQFDVGKEPDGHYKKHSLKLHSVKFVDLAEYQTTNNLLKDGDALHVMHHLHSRVSVTRSSICKGKPPACMGLLPFTSVQGVGIKQTSTSESMPGAAARGTLTFQRSPLRSGVPGCVASPQGIAVQTHSVDMSPGLLNDSRHSQDLPEEPWYPLLFERLHSTVELGLKTPVAVVFVSTTDEFWALHTEGHPEKCFESLMAGLPPALTGSTLTPGRSFLLLHDEVNSVLSAKEVTEAFNTLSSILPPSACHLLKIGAKNTSLDTDALECIQSFFLSCFPVRPPSLTKLHQLSQSSPKNPMTFTSPLEYPTLNVQDLSPLCDRMGWGELRDIFHLVRRLLKRTVIPTLVRRTEQLDAVSLDKRTFRSQLKGLVSNWGPPHDRTYSESQEAQQAVSMGDLLVWQDNWARAAQVYKAAGNEERQSGPQTGLLFELTAVCLFMAGESSRRELEQLFNQAHKEYSDSLVAMDHTVPSVSDLLTQSTYFISRLPKKNVSASLIATTLFENTPFVKELQKSSLLTRMALRSHMLASYVLTCFVTHRPSLALFQFRPLNALPGSRTADQPPLPSQGGLSVRRELASCVAAVDEAAELLRVAFFNWSETAHRRLIVFVNLLRNTGDVLKQDGSALQPSTQLFVSGIAILTDALDFVAKAVSLVSATLLERISFNLEIVGRVTSVVHWIQALPHDMPPVLPAVRRMRRKSLFYLIFAGHTYNKLGLKDLSLRCFNLVLPYFSSASAPLPLVAQTCVELMTGKFTDSVGRRRVPLRVALAHDPRGMTQTTGCWRAILSHLRFTMARQAFASELNPASLVHFLELLNLAATSAHFGMLKDPNNRDQIHMKELLFVCKTLGLTTHVPLSVPIVMRRTDAPSVFVSVLLEGDEPPESERGHFSSTTVDVPHDAEAVTRLIRRSFSVTGQNLSAAEEMELKIQSHIIRRHEQSWAELLPQVVPGPTLQAVSGAPLFDNFPSFHGLHVTGPRTGGVGSAAAVELLLCNPLGIPLDCNKMRLSGVFIHASGHQEVFPNPKASNPPLEVFNFDCRLSPYATSKIRFYARFNQSGRVVFTSLMWTLFHIVPCRVPLTVAGPLRRHEPLAPVGHPVFYSPALPPPSMLVTALDASGVQENAWRYWGVLGDCAGRRALGGAVPPAIAEEAVAFVNKIPGSPLHKPLVLQQWSSYLPDYRLTLTISLERPRISYLMRQWPLGAQQKIAPKRTELLIQNTGSVPIHTVLVIVDSPGVLTLAGSPRAYVDTTTVSKGDVLLNGLAASYSHPLLPSKCVSIPLKLTLEKTCRCQLLVMASSTPLEPPSEEQVVFDKHAAYDGSSIYNPQAQRSDCPLSSRVWLLISKPVVVSD